MQVTNVRKNFNFNRKYIYFKRTAAGCQIRSWFFRFFKTLLHSVPLTSHSMVLHTHTSIEWEVKGPDGECLGCFWSLLFLNHQDNFLEDGSGTCPLNHWIRGQVRGSMGVAESWQEKPQRRLFSWSGDPWCWELGAISYSWKSTETWWEKHWVFMVGSWVAEWGRVPGSPGRNSIKYHLS